MSQGGHAAQVGVSSQPFLGTIDIDTPHTEKVRESFGGFKLLPYLCSMNRKKRRKDKFANWLLDIAKYITTAVIISPLFQKMEDEWYILIAGIAVVGASLGWGMYLTQDDDPKNKKKG